MEKFKEIAEKCLAGELSGRFKNRKGEDIPSETLGRSASKTYPYVYCLSYGVTMHGEYYKSGKSSEYDIIDFIPDNMQKQVKIDIPEGKVPVMEQTESGVVITWKEKELTYDDVCTELQKHRNIIGNPIDNSLSDTFHKKVWTLRKLINIRNYFGKPISYDRGYCICYDSYTNKFYVGNINTIGIWTKDIVFTEKEHAEQAIKMLGNELKYLFEPW